MICPKCGKELPDGSVFCTECGQSMEINAKPAVTTECPDVCRPKVSIWETFKNAVKNFYKDFTSGRASRKEFWSTFLFSVLFLFIPWSLCLLFLTTITSNPDSTGVLLLFIPFMIVLIPFAFFGILFELTLLRLWIRRAHDVGNPWGFIFIPFYRIILLFLPGTKGPNKYGEKPEN